MTNAIILHIFNVVCSDNFPVHAFMILLHFTWYFPSAGLPYGLDPVLPVGQREGRVV